MRSKTIFDAFQHAIDGILYAYRTQRHIRFHFTVIILVIFAARIFHFERDKMVPLFFAISLVLICEMFNTALEAAVDLFTDKYHLLAKHAKDVAAGAVLIATLNAIAIGGLLFFDERSIRRALEDLMATPQVMDLSPILTMTITVILTFVFMWKVWGRKGTPLHGGVVSGHAALAFFMASVILLISESWAAAAIGFLLALLVAQSRIEGHIHTLRETILGALVGIIITLLMFQALPGLMQRLVRYSMTGGH